MAWNTNFRFERLIMELLNFGYWLFSTLVQAMAALFAVVGVFVVFKIQILREKLRPLMEVAKTTYIRIRKIHEDTANEEYRKVTVYTLEEMISKFEELITKKRKALINNKKTLKEAIKNNSDSFGPNYNIPRIEKEISYCEDRLDPLKRINQNLRVIKEKGISSLKEIGVVFILSLILLFLNWCMSVEAIITMGILVVIYVVVTVIRISLVIIESLDAE